MNNSIVYVAGVIAILLSAAGLILLPVGNAVDQWKVSPLIAVKTGTSGGFNNYVITVNGFYGTGQNDLFGYPVWIQGIPQVNLYLMEYVPSCSTQCIALWFPLSPNGQGTFITNSTGTVGSFAYTQQISISTTYTFPVTFLFRVSSVCGSNCPHNSPVQPVVFS